MSDFNKQKLELLQDINKVIQTIDDKVDTFIVSRFHKNTNMRKVANDAFIKKVKKTTDIAKVMSNKYER